MRSGKILTETCAACGLRYELTEDGLTCPDAIAD